VLGFLFVVCSAFFAALPCEAIWHGPASALAMLAAEHALLQWCRQWAAQYFDTFAASMTTIMATLVVLTATQT